MLNNLEKQTSVPKVYAFLGLLGVYFFLIFFNIAGEFLVNIAGFIVPGYYSLEALFSVGKTDDTQVSPLLTVTFPDYSVLTSIICSSCTGVAADFVLVVDGMFSALEQLRSYWDLNTTTCYAPIIST